MNHPQLCKAVAHLFSSNSAFATGPVLERAGLPAGAAIGSYYASPWFDSGEAEGQLTDGLAVAKTSKGLKIGVQIKVLAGAAKLTMAQWIKFAERGHSAKWRADYGYHLPAFLAIGTSSVLKAHADVLTQPWQTISVEELAHARAALDPFGDV